MPSDFDINRARNDTRYCDERIHFNNAGASLMPAPVSDALHSYLQDEERYGGYETAERHAAQLSSFYEASARLLNCDADEIAYVENATRGFDMVFYALRFKPGDRILTSISEYGSNLIAYLQQARRMGAEVVHIPDDEHGQLDIAALRSLIDDRVKLVSVSHIPTGGGLVNPVAAVGEVARSADIPFILDSCQGIGQMPIDVKAIACDAVCGTGRKYLRGPRGTGLLYVRRKWAEALEPPLLDQHAAELISETEYRIHSGARRFENWEQFFAGKAALAHAIHYAESYGLDAIWRRVQELAEELRRRLSQIDGIRITDLGQRRCGIVTFVSAKMHADDIKQSLSKKNINVSVSSGSGSFITFKKRGLSAVVRASVHYFNTSQEIDSFCLALQETLTASR